MVPTVAWAARGAEPISLCVSLPILPTVSTFDITKAAQDILLLRCIANRLEQKQEASILRIMASVANLYSAVHAAWTEGRLENVLERQKQLALLHGNVKKSSKQLIATIMQGSGNV